jgi:hypothetical protein
MISVQIKNQKDKDQSFIFPIKKTNGKFNIFKKFQCETP